MPELIIKIVELTINFLGLILPQKSDTQKTIVILPISIRDSEKSTFPFNPSNESVNSKDWSLIIALLLLISATLCTFFYQVISIILFIATLLFTILKFQITHKYELAHFAKKDLDFRATLYSAMALSTFFIPDFLSKLQSTLPKPSDITQHFSNLLIWISKSITVFWKQFILLDTVSQFLVLLFIFLRIFLLYNLFSDIRCIISRRQLASFIKKVENNKSKEIGFLCLLSILCFIACNFELIYKPLFIPIINYFS